MRKLMIFAFLYAATIAPAQALEFEQKGKIVFVSGANIDFPDVGRFEDAFAKGVDTVVLSKMGGGRTDVLASVGRAIKKAGVTTVAADWCGPSCAYLFMAGKQRRFGVGPTGKTANPVFLSLSGTHIEGSSRAGRSSAQYAYFKDAFGEGMPFDLLNKYTTNGVVGEYVVFTKPSKDAPEGQILDCVIKEDANGKKGSDCKPNEGLTSLRVGALTAVEPFDISGAAPAASPATTKAGANAVATPSAVPSSSSLAGTTPSLLISEKNVASIVMARKMTREDGAQGIGSVFSPEGKLALVMAFQWDANQEGGSHSLQVKWYRDGKLVKTERENVQDWRKPPFTQWLTLNAVDLGVGSFVAEVIVDGRVVGKKQFSIKEG